MLWHHQHCLLLTTLVSVLAVREQGRTSDFFDYFFCVKLVRILSSFETARYVFLHELVSKLLKYH